MDGNSFQAGEAGSFDRSKSFVLDLDKQTIGDQQVSTWPRRYPVDIAEIAFEGRLVLNYTSNPTGIGGERVIVVDRVTGFRPIPDREMPEIQRKVGL